MRKTLHELIAPLWVLLALAGSGRAALAQTPAAGTGTAELREVKSDGQKILTEAQIASFAGLRPGA